MNQSSNSMEVLNPPNETFESEVSFYETQSSYSEYTNNMLPRIQDIIDENQKLKSIIKKHSEDFANKISYLQQWKLNWSSKMKHVADVKSHIKEKLMLLETSNSKYELEYKGNTNGIETIDENQCGQELRKKYLNTLLKLERELKEMKEGKKIVEKSEFLLNNKVSQLENDRIHLQNCIDGEKRRFQLIGQSLNDLRKAKEAADAKCKEMQVQIISLLNERELFQNEISELKKGKEEMSMRFNRIETEKLQYYEMYESVNQEKLQLMNNQEKKISEVSHLRAKLDEKEKAIDELYNELTKCQNLQQDSNVDNLLARLISAEESLKKRDLEFKDIDAKKKDLELKFTKSEENVQFFKEQAEVYKDDFLIERKDRTQQNELNHQLKSLILEKDHQIEQFRRQIDQINYDAILRNPQNSNR